MNYYYKYLKYRNKYLSLKKDIIMNDNNHRNINMIGGNRIIVNLDYYKDLFRKCIYEIPNELGFNLLLYDDMINFEVIKGTNNSITFPYNNVVNIHTHPFALYKNFEYQPPTHSDYIQAYIDYFKGTQFNIVVEKAGVWYYTPNKELIKEIEKIQPNAKEIFSSHLVEGECERFIEGLTDRYHDLYDVILTNTSNHGIYLNFEGDNIINVLSNVFIDDYIKKKIEETKDDNPDMINIYIKEAEEILHTLSLEELHEIAPHYHKIELCEYINNIKNIVADNMGFDVMFFNWEEEFLVEIELNETALRIFRDIKSRNFMIDDIETIIRNIDRTEENYIIRP